MMHAIFVDTSVIDIAQLSFLRAVQNVTEFNITNVFKDCRVGNELRSRMP
jgi:hypothetical protein